MIIYVVIKLIDCYNEGYTCKIVFSSENKNACKFYIINIEKCDENNENENYEIHYFIDKIEL